MTDEEKLEDYPLVREELRKREEQLREILMIIRASEDFGNGYIPVKMIKDVFK